MGQLLTAPISRDEIIKVPLIIKELTRKVIHIVDEKGSTVLYENIEVLFRSLSEERYNEVADSIILSTNIIVNKVNRGRLICK